MARPRKQPSAWAKRNAAARKAGYTSYYDYRAHGFGKRAPSEPRFTGEQLARLRGHRSQADLSRAVKAGKVELVIIDPGKRDPKTGRYRDARAVVTMDDGSERSYWLRGGQIGGAAGRRLATRLVDAGVHLLDAYKLLAGPVK